MDPAQIALLVEQLLQLGFTIYQQVQSSETAGSIKPLADIMAEADAKFAQIGATADAEIAALDAKNPTF